jgi:hypothetical protein
MVDHEVDAETEEKNGEEQPRSALKITALGAVLRVLLRRIESGCTCPTWLRKDGKPSVIAD